MEVYEFDKNYLKRLDESEMVLKTLQMNPVPASQVRSAWANFIELQIEPTGWYALWKISRVTCEDLKIKYPTIVYGKCENVLHKELKAIFNILAVQDDDVHLPEQQIVLLEELWPTIEQPDDPALNVEQTADCIDQLRFFYNHIWFPWDNHLDDNIDWAEQHLRSRFRLAYHIKTDMKMQVANHVKMLLKESNYLERRREYLEMDLSDAEDDDADAADLADDWIQIDKDIKDEIAADDDNKKIRNQDNKTPITELMHVHLRMITIKNEMELLENPVTRKVYTAIKFPNLNEPSMGVAVADDSVQNNKRIKTSTIKSSQNNVFIVLKQNNLSDEIKYLENVQKIIDDPDHPDQKTIQFCTNIQECFTKCHPFDEIYIPIGIHTIELLEYLTIKGKIFGVVIKPHLNLDGKMAINDGKTQIDDGNTSIDDNKMDVIDNVDDKIHNNSNNSNKLFDERFESIIQTTIHDSILLIISSENFWATNITFDCRNVRTGIIIRKGCSVTFKNCKFLGPPNVLTSTNIGIVAGANSTLTIIDCLISDFGNGISLHEKSTVTIQNSVIKNCINGIEMVDNCKLDLLGSSSSSIHSNKYGISYETKFLLAENRDGKHKRIYENCMEMRSDHPNNPNIQSAIANDCNFNGNQFGNVNLFMENPYNVWKSKEMEDDDDDDDDDDF